MMWDLLLVAAASGLAGCVDAIVGGGGLILVPALFATYPAAPPATLMGTNKGGAIWGTAWAAGQFARRVQLRWAALGPAVGAALLGSLVGAWTLTLVHAESLRRALPFVLAAILLYTLLRKDLGRVHAPRLHGRAEALVASAIGLAIGFYDGFFGPGTGSMFIIAFHYLLRMDLVSSSANSKTFNFASNIGALVAFVIAGKVVYLLALPLVACNILGNHLGSALALRKGNEVVRKALVFSMLCLFTSLGVKYLA